MRILRWLLAIAFVCIALYAIGEISGEADAASVTWKQSAGSFASNNANWENGTAPTTGDDVYFTSLSTASCSWDVTATIRYLSIGSGYSGTITQSANDINIGARGYLQSGGTFTGVTTNWVNCAGDFIKNAGTFTADVSKIKMTGTGKYLSNNAAYTLLYALEISGDVTVENGAGNFYVDNGASRAVTISGTMRIGNGETFYDYCNSATTITGSVLCTGTGQFKYARTAAGSVNLLTMTGRIDTLWFAAPTANSVIYVASSAMNIGTLRIYSDGAGTTTFNGNGYTIVTENTFVGLRGVLLGSGTVSVSGYFDSYNGTSSGSWSLSIGGTGYIKTPSGNTINGLTITSGNVRLASNVNVTKQFIMTGGAITNNGKYIDIKNGCNVTIASGCSYSISFSHYWNRMNITGTLLGSGTNSIWCNASSAVNGTMTGIYIHANSFFTFRGTLTYLLIETAYRSTFFANGTATYLTWNLTSQWNFRPYTAEWPGYIISRAIMYYIEPTGGYYIYISRFDTSISYQMRVTHWGNESWQFDLKNLGASPTVFTYTLSVPDIDDHAVDVVVDNGTAEEYAMVNGIFTFTSLVASGTTHNYLMISVEDIPVVEHITTDQMAILAMCFGILALLTYAAFHAQPFYIIAGFGWIAVALFEVEPVQSTIALICVGVGLIFMLWGVYKVIDG